MSILSIVPALKFISPQTYSQNLFDVPGTYTWVCPPFCSSISVICIGGGGGGGRDGAGGGGGGLAFVNNYSVTPGQSYTVVVGNGGTGGPTPTDGGDSSFNAAIIGRGGKAPVGSFGGFGGAFTAPGGGGGYGGFGGAFNISLTPSVAGGQGSTGGGGGGAGGYGANGGNGGNGSNPTSWTRSYFGDGSAGLNGGGGGGGASTSVYGNGNGTPSGGGGGGTGIFGNSSSTGGVAGTGSTDYGVAPLGGGGGTGGTKGENGSVNFLGGNAGGAGGLYGGGGGGSNGSGNGFGFTRNDSNSGGRGAVGIIIGSTIWGSYPTYYQSVTGGTATNNGVNLFRAQNVTGSGQTILGNPPAYSTSWPPPGWTSVRNASADDANSLINFPFTFYFNGTGYNGVYVGSNFYLTFGAGSSTLTVSATSPALNKIMIAAGDRSFQRLAYQTDNSNYVRIRVEGETGVGGTPGLSSQMYEIYFYNPSITPENRSLIQLNIGNFSMSGVSGLYSSTTQLVSFVPFNSNSYVFFSSNSLATAWSAYQGYSIAGS